LLDFFFAKNFAKNFCEIFLQKFLDQKIFGSRNFFGSKNFWIKKFLDREIFLDQKIFGSRNFFGSKIFVKIFAKNFWILDRSIQVPIQNVNFWDLSDGGWSA